MKIERNGAAWYGNYVIAVPRRAISLATNYFAFCAVIFLHKQIVLFSLFVFVFFSSSNETSNLRVASHFHVIVITFYSSSYGGQETPKKPFGLRVKLPTCNKPVLYLSSCVR